MTEPLEGRVSDLENGLKSLRRAYLALDGDLEELIEKGYRKMHRYRMEEFRQQEKEQKPVTERQLLSKMLQRAVDRSSVSDEQKEE